MESQKQSSLFLNITKVVLEMEWLSDAWVKDRREELK
jgi:hypothetical protein